MVRSISDDTNDTITNRNPSYVIFHEFYGNKCLNKSISNLKFIELFIKSFAKFFHKLPKIEIIASDPVNTRNTVLLAYIQMQIIKNSIKFPRRHIQKSMKLLFQKSTFRKLYFLACKIIFALPISQLCKNLKLKCCNSLGHFSFCLAK